MIKSNIGKYIKYYRKVAGLSQDELAVKLGVRRQTISSWEVDRTEPSILDVQKMADVFGCKVTDIVPDGTAARLAAYDAIINEYTQLSDDNKKQVNDYIRFLAYKEAIENAEEKTAPEN